MNLLSKDLKARVTIETKSTERALSKLEKKIQSINKAVNSVNKNSSRFSTGINRSIAPTRRLASHANQVNNNFKKANSTVSTLTSKLKRLAGIYLGVMGTRAAVQTSDVITSAENRLNNLNGGNTKQTQESLDKMYASSQKVRMGYQDMMNNVSKSITLAGDAFQGNIDNAIRFQEIMAEAYALGGASAAEMSSSMYQMIQALGSGILQGDELRSVREGAPVAYREIEKFAQGVLKTNDSLKELASNGEITAELVVAAIMNAGDKMDKQFEKTQMTFAQAWTNIKNIAIKSFEPVLQMMNDALNSDFGQGLMNGIMIAIQIVALALRTVFNLVSAIYNFIAENWGVISRILIFIGIVMAIVLFPKFIAWITYLLTVIAHYLYLGAVAVLSAIKAAIAWMMVNPVLALIIAILLIVIAVIIWTADSFADACGNIVGAVYWVLGVIHNVIAFIINLVLALLSAIVAVATNIGTAFYNGWQNAKAYFWDFVASVMEGCGDLINAINAVLSALGKETINVSFASNKANAARASKKEYLDVGAITSEAFNVVPYANLSDMFDKGHGYGESGANWVTEKLSNLANSLGLGAGALPSASDYDIANSYDPTQALAGLTDPTSDPAKDTKKIKDNTGKMADSMELTQEDLEYLRKIAEMEWKKEYTTANIKVEMNNNNNINGESDLDGIVTKLTDKLYEELSYMANGVYV